MAKRQPVVRVVTATEAKNRFGELIKGAYLRAEHLIVKRDGIPVVAIVPIADYERLISPDEQPAEVVEAVRGAAEREVARRSLAELLERVYARLPDVPQEEAEADIEEAIRAVRSGA